MWQVGGAFCSYVRFLFSHMFVGTGVPYGSSLSVDLIFVMAWVIVGRFVGRFFVCG